jgi:hypothetical protein
MQRAGPLRLTMSSPGVFQCLPLTRKCSVGSADRRRCGLRLLVVPGQKTEGAGNTCASPSSRCMEGIDRAQTRWCSMARQLRFGVESRLG